MKFIHISNQDIDLKKKYKNRHSFKPSGLWLSPIKALKNSSTFFDWQHSEGLDLPGRVQVVEINNSVIVKIKNGKLPRANQNCILQIRNFRDVAIMVKRFGAVWVDELGWMDESEGHGGTWTMINWTEVFTKYGGILFRPYDRQKIFKSGAIDVGTIDPRLWYKMIDGESLCLVNLNLIESISSP